MIFNLNSYTLPQNLKGSLIKGAGCGADRGIDKLSRTLRLLKQSAPLKRRNLIYFGNMAKFQTFASSFVFFIM